jgi:hypothetical protein
MTLDVTDRQRLDAVVMAAAERFGGLDVVIANAGISVDPPMTIAAVEEREFERVIEIDLLGVWRTVRAALPQIIARRGHVVLTASIYAFCNGVINAACAISKAGASSLAVRCERSSRRTALPPACSIPAGLRHRSFEPSMAAMPSRPNCSGAGGQRRCARRSPLSVSPRRRFEESSGDPHASSCPAAGSPSLC